MNYQVIINPELGGTNLGNKYNGVYEKDYNLRFSKLLNEKLNSLGIKSTLVRDIDKNMTDIERLNYINNNLGNNSIILSTGLGSDNIEIIYGLNSNDNLASRLANNFEENEFIVDKYYQRRDSKNTNLDYDYIIRNLPNNESIIIRYGNISDSYINDRINDLVDVTANTIRSYLGLANDYYIVKANDNLYSIARKFNTTVDTLKKLNNLTNNNLSIGQKLLIKSVPSTLKDNNVYYTVKANDNLYSIANKYNMTVNELKKLNNLTSNIINIGQKLIVNSGNKNSKNTYIVKSGDTFL